ncbi:hypothetical protein PRIPAC_94167 [Pristionchus pacificus]|uniref:Uncharacterized protein n=1 Tax=Pristionchus pacificus TaxID=54126 RepID=A0A2A6CED0_PRIPA|nr:hypothetical protein PRIPAC_94167 [Pristionchus pacificus]|eukprot:PDM76457.1 hypothetical protein PRIPAC_40061 [Pristionchus pacificus]
MSLLNFPPPAAQDCSYSLQEFNGQIIAGTRKQFETLQESKFLTDYPRLERNSLSKLQHSLSRDDVKGAFMFRRSTANVLREIDEGKGVSAGDNDENAGGAGGWGKAVQRMRSGLGGMLLKMVPTDAQTSLADALDKYAATRGWMTAIDTSDENNELGLLFGEEKKMDETMPTSVINSLRETAAEIRNGNQQVSDNGVPRLVRSKRMALAISTEPRDVLQRVSDGVLKLREKLLTREKNNKGATNKSVAEFERYFDDEKVIIDADITILDGALVVLSGESKEKARLLLNYEDERRKVDDMTEAFVKAVDGTRFTDVLELRNNFDTLSERLKERDERDANILNGTDFESIEQMAKNVRTVRSESNDTRLREVVTVALSDLGLKDMVEVVEEVNELRDKNDQMADLIELIMKEVQVLRMNEIIDSIQMSIIERNELEKKFKELKIHFSTAMDMVDKLTIERNEVAAELNEIKKKDAKAADAEKRAKAAAIFISSSYSGTDVANARKWRSEREISEPGENILPLGGNGTGAENALPLAIIGVDPSKLPQLLPFDGAKESWKVFRDGFLMRYEHMGNDAAKQILIESLTGRAAIEYKGLPDDYRKKSIRDCLSWLEERCFGGALFSALDIERSFRAMKPHGRRVDDVCFELESMVARMHPGDTRKQEEVKRLQLTIVYERSAEYRELLKMLKENKQYSEMKSHLQVSEYMGRLNRYQRYDNGGHGSDQWNTRNGNGSRSDFDRFAKECYGCGEMGHPRNRCPNGQGAGDNRDTPQVIENQVNEVNTPQTIPPAGTGNSRRSGENRYGSGNNGNSNRYNAAARKLTVGVETCGGVARRKALKQQTMEAGEDQGKMRGGMPQFFKKSRSVNGIIGGLQMSACLDSGADVSLIDKRRVDLMQDGLQIIPDVQYEICDAQKKTIKTVQDTIAVDVKMDIGNPCKVGFLVAESDIDEVLLGTCALEAMGLEMRLKDESRMIRDTVAPAVVKGNERGVPYIDIGGNAVVNSLSRNRRVEFPDENSSCSDNVDVVLRYVVLGRAGNEERKHGESTEEHVKAQARAVSVDSEAERANCRQVTVVGNPVCPDYQCNECGRRILDIISKNGVSADSKVNDSLTDDGGAKQSRQSLVAFVPSCSRIMKCYGDWRQLECITYEDEEDLKLKIKSMEAANSFPKSIVILLKMEFARKALNDFRSYMEEIVKKTDVAAYIGSDILPMKASEVQVEAVKVNQMWLTQWRLENPMKNLIIISAISALIWSIHPLVSVFIIAKKETKELFEGAVELGTLSNQFRTRMTAIDTSDENNELGLLFGEEKKMDETMPTSVINSLRETAAEIRNGNQQVSDNGVPRLVRSKRMALAISTEPRDVLQRVSDGVLKLREKLLTREKNNKGATNKSVAEFERYFDDEKVIIDADITILDGALVVLSGESKEKARLLLNYEDERRKVDDMTEAFVKAVDGTRFTDVLELRNNFDTLSERLKERDERDANILNGTDFESIEQMAKNVRTVRSESNDTRLREVVTVALSDLGLKDMVEVVEEVNELRDKNDQMADLIELIMKEVQVLRMNEIIDSIQMSIIERNELEKKFKELKIHFSTAMDMVDKLTIERNEVAAELNEIKKKDAKAADAEKRAKAAAIFISSSYSGTDVANARKWRSEREISEPGENILPLGGNGTGAENALPLAIIGVDPSKLPQLLPFDGAKESWKVFRDGFLMRYEHMGNDAAKQILIESLTGRAAIEYKGLPDDYRKKSIRDCLSWLEERCFGGALFSALDIERSFRAMKPHGRRVDDVCFELESMVARMHPGDTRKQEEVKRLQLTIVYERSAEYRELLKMLKENKQYSEMKSHLQVSEYMGRLNRYQRYDNGGHGSDQWNTRNGNGSRSDFDRFAKECYGCGEMGHPRNRCPNGQGAGDNRDTPQVIENQVNEVNTPQTIPPAGTGNSRRSGENRYGSGNNGNSNRYNAAARKLTVGVETCGGVARRKALKQQTMEAGEDQGKMRGGMPQFFKKSRSVNGIIGGLQMSACLDSGADVSLIDKRRVDLMQDGLQIIPDVQYEICDAQKKTIKTVQDTIAVDVKMDIGNPCKVGFLVAESDIDEVLLGTCALEAMGLEMRLKDESRMIRDTVAPAVVKGNERGVPYIDIGGNAVVNSLSRNRRVEFPDENSSCSDNVDVVLRYVVLGRAGNEERKHGESTEEHVKAQARAVSVDSEAERANCRQVTVVGNPVCPDYQCNECGRRILDIISKNGVSADSKVNDSLTDDGGAKQSRQSLVAFVPSCSRIMKCYGDWRQLECITYEDEEDLKLKIKSMEAANSFPKSIVILLKMEFARKALNDFRSYMEEIVKKTDVAAYIGSDILPMKASEVQVEAVKVNQMWLTQWRLENPMKNLIIISAISALIWSIHPLVSVFIIAKKETKELFEGAVELGTLSNQFRTRMTAIDTSDENNELGLLFGEEKKMDETMPTSVINSLRETAAEIRNGNQQVSDNGVPRLVRSKRMALAISTEPRDVLQRVSDGVLKLREKLLTREKNNKGATNKSVAEFERYFDDEKVIIDADITILDGALVVLSGESKEKARLLLNYEDERRKVDDMTEAFVKAVDGTRFTDVLELRNNFDTLSERLKERDERDANILNGTDFESIEQMAKNVRTVRSESNDTRLREVVTVALSDLGLKDMVEVVEEVNEFRLVPSHAWLRCVAVDGEGARVAVCQSTDYIRIYGIGADSQQPPLTLHHAKMKNVAAMQFEPSAQCIRIIETGVSPLSSLVWDSAWGNSLMAASCTTNKIILADLSTGTHSSVGAWFGGGVTGLYPSKDGTRLAVTYTSNVMRIYDRATWTDEKWGGLAGRATGVVWAPNGESLIFSTEEAEQLFALSFTRHARTGEDGVKMISWSSGPRAMPIYDLSPIEFDPLKEATEEMMEHSNLRALVQIGGAVRSMACSADGERLAVTFASQDSAGFIATFIVDWTALPVKLYPTGFVEAAFAGIPEAVFFLPQYSAGSMLAISWSTGSVQYVPLIYGKTPAAAALSVHPLVESTGVHTILEESLGWATGNDSLASVELSSRLIDREEGDSPICFSEMLKERSMVGREI